MKPLKIVEVLYYRLLYAFLVLFGLLPFPISKMVFGNTFYFITYNLLRYRYEVVLQNLSRSLPNRSYSEIRQISKAFYRHLSTMVIETARLCTMPRNIARKKLQISNREMIMGFYKQNRSIIAVLGHYGNWEYLNILPSYFPFPINAIYKPVTNPVMGKLIHRIRTRFGMHLVPSNQALRYLLKQKGQPQMSIFIADQFPGMKDKEQFSFLHQSTTMFNGAEKLAIATDSVVVYLDLKRKTDDCWELIFSLITESAPLTGDQEITRTFAGKLQDTIFDEPAYWLWSHRRLKKGIL